MQETRLEPASQTIVAGFPSTMGDDYQLNTSTLLRHAARTHGAQEIVYRCEGGFSRYTYRDALERVARTANALRSLGVGPKDRVGVLDWNSRRHFELYYAVPAIGAVLLELNLRLTTQELAYIASHSGASVICVDASLLPIAEALAPHLPGIKGWIVMSDAPAAAADTALQPAHDHETLLAAASPAFDWPMIDERAAYAAAYTSGTTGLPKGVYYSHRSIYLHSTALALMLGMSLDDTTMLVTPMFHAQGWGLPQAATLMANRIVLPGRYTVEDIGMLVDTMVAERVTIASGVPSIVLPMMRYIESLAHKPDFRRLRLLCGGSQAPLSIMTGLHALTGAEVVHAYGGTETSPLVSVNRLKPALRESLSPEQCWDVRCTQGLPNIGVDIKILGADGRELEHDGRSAGEICVRGPWCTTRYHDLPQSEERFIGGYWRSGDVGGIDAHGYLKLTDRLKDLIKSGGEWISSIDMETLLACHPAVAEAVVVGLPHPVWAERPFALVVLKPGAHATVSELREHLLGKFSKWQLPDEIRFVGKLPKTSVGKLNKKAVRADYACVYSSNDEATL